MTNSFFRGLSQALGQPDNDTATSAYSTFQTQYYNDRVSFVRDCISWRPGKGPAFYQEDVLRLFDQGQNRVSARGPRGLGKTAVASWLILHFALTRDGKDWKAPTTAGSWAQLTRYLWPEIHKWARRLRWDVIGRPPFNTRTELLALSLKLKTGEAFGVASTNPDLIEGAHAEHLFFLFDESKAIKPVTFDSMEGAFSNAGEDTAGEAFVAAMSTPGEPNGRFYDIQSRKPGYEDWKVKRVTLQDTIKAGIISQKWVAQRKKQWGETDPRFINQVMGDFAAADVDGIIRLSWVESANERWQEWADAGKPGKLKIVSADIAGGGADSTVYGYLYEWTRLDGSIWWAIDKLEYRNHRDTMKTADEIADVLDANPGVLARVDSIGIGAGVYHRLNQLKKKVEGFNAAHACANKDRSGQHTFTNKRSAGWWLLGELLNPDFSEGGTQLALPPEDALTGDLIAPHYRELAGGKIQVESKPDIKDRIGRSTDAGDTVMMAVFEDLAVNPWAQQAMQALEKKRLEAEAAAKAIEGERADATVLSEQAA